MSDEAKEWTNNCSVNGQTRRQSYGRAWLKTYWRIVSHRCNRTLQHQLTTRFVHHATIMHRCGANSSFLMYLEAFLINFLIYGLGCAAWRWRRCCCWLQSCVSANQHQITKSNVSIDIFVLALVCMHCTHLPWTFMGSRSSPFCCWCAPFTIYPILCPTSNINCF